MTTATLIAYVAVATCLAAAVTTVLLIVAGAR